MAEEDGTGSVVAPILEAVSKAIVDKIGPLGTAAAESFFQHFKDSLSGVSSGSAPASATSTATASAAPANNTPTKSAAGSVVEVDGVAKLKEFLSSGKEEDVFSTLTKHIKGLAGDTSELSSGFTTLLGIATKSDTVLAAGAQLAAKQYLELANKAKETIAELEKPLSFDKSFLNSFTGFSSDLDDVKLGIVSYREEIGKAGQMGISTEKSVAGLKALASETGLSIGRIQQLGAKIQDNLNAPRDAFSGFAGLERLIVATGIDGKEAFGLLTKQLTEFNTEAGDALTFIPDLNQLIQGTNQSMTGAAQVVSKGASDFNMLGGNIKGVELIYKEFLKGLGRGQEGIAGLVTDKTLKSLSSMNTEMKAFIGMTTNLGQGGGSLESALRVEEALASGEGLQEVFDSIFAQAEKISGTPLMTRKEALESGQAQQYFTQKATVNQMLGGGFSDLELEKMFQARQGGKDVTLEDVTGKINDQFYQTSQERLDIDIGPLTRQIEKLSSAVELKGSEKASEQLRNLGESANKVGTEFEKFGKNLFEGIGEGFEALFSSMRGKKGVDVIGIAEKRVTGLPTDKNDFKTGASAAGALGAAPMRGNEIVPAAADALINPQQNAATYLNKVYYPESAKDMLPPPVQFEVNKLSGDKASQMSDELSTLATSVENMIDKIQNMDDSPLKFKISLVNDSTLKLEYVPPPAITQ